MLLEKLKEKNSAIGRAVSEALALMHKYCFALLDVAEDVIGALRGGSRLRGMCWRSVASV